MIDPDSRLIADTIDIPNHEVWSIDATILVLSSGNYLVFSSFQGSLQSLWIAEMTSPTTVGDAYLISEPTLSWETEGAAVNEGPGVFHLHARDVMSC